MGAGTGTELRTGSTSKRLFEQRPIFVYFWIFCCLFSCDHPALKSGHDRAEERDFALFCRRHNWQKGEGVSVHFALCISASTRQRPPGAQWPRRTRTTTTTGSASSTLCPRRSTLSYRDSGDRHHAAPLRPPPAREVPEEAADGGLLLLLLLLLPSARQHPGRGVLRRGPEERAEDAQVIVLLTPTYFPICMYDENNSFSKKIIAGRSSTRTSTPTSTSGRPRGSSPPTRYSRSWATQDCWG